MQMNQNLGAAVRLSETEAGVAVLALNRPTKRNALSQGLIDELLATLRQLDEDQAVRSIVLTSVGDSPFCAGADLNDLAKLSTAEAFRTGWLKDLEDGLSACGKPILAAVRGFAFGGGFELALMCDMIFAAQDARFGFPEIKLGTIPGAGGTQRLTKAIGKQRVMELVMTGVPTSAIEMERFGVVNRVVRSEEDVAKEAIKVAQMVAAFSAPATRLAKQAIKTAEATTLDAGLALERALYYSSFSHADCQEGIAAFLQKRPANFLHE